MSLPRLLSSTNQSDIEQFVTDGEQENSYLEFKRELPSTWDNATKHEFIADISAFANAGGGDLIFGIQDDGEGIARKVIPQQINPDQDTRRLQDFLLNLVEPRIPACEVFPVPVNVDGQSGYIIVVRTIRSWAGPHRVKTNQHFYIREGLRKRQIDVQELRSLFIRSESQGSRIRDFRTDRISRILTGDTPCQLKQGAIMVLHLFPTQSALESMSIEPSNYLPGRMVRPRNLPIFSTLTGSTHINFDGAVTVIPSREIETNGYSIFFRNGFYESVKIYNSRSDSNGKFYLPSQLYESECIQLVDRFREELGSLGINSEIVVMFSLLNANQTMLGLSQEQSLFISGGQGKFDRQHLLLPDFFVPSKTEAVDALRPMFDLVWQSCGFPKSFNYNDNRE